MTNTMTMHKLVATKILFMLWLEWVEQGTKESKYFGTNYGLCHASYGMFKVSHLLYSLFNGINCPFGGIETYLDECEEDTMHLNAQRLQFVRDFLEEHRNLPVVFSSKLYEDAVGVPFVKGVTNTAMINS